MLFYGCTTPSNKNNIVTRCLLHHFYTHFPKFCGTHLVFLETSEFVAWYVPIMIDPPEDLWELRCYHS